MRKNLLLLLLLAFISGGLSAQVVYDDFEYDRNVYYEFVHGTLSEYADNPNTGGANTSEKCGLYTRNAGEQFDVLVILPGGIMADVSSFVAGTKTMSIDVYSPAAGIPLQITLEDSAMAGPFNYPVGRHSVYFDTTTVANQWETLDFQYSFRPDGSVPDTTITSLILLFNPGTFTGDSYYWDNLVGPDFSDPCANVPSEADKLFEDFECQRNLIYEFPQGPFERRLNPVTTGNNTSEFAGQYTRNPDSTGTDVIVSRFSQALDLSSRNQFKMMVYGNTADVTLSLQAGTTEILAVTEPITTANTWEELTFDFSSISANNTIDHAVILFDPGSTSPDVFWFDNFKADTMVTVVSVPEELGNAGTEIGLYPNPSQNQANLSFDLTERAAVKVSLFDLQGRALFTAFEGEKGVGSHEIPFSTQQLQNGAYIWRLEINGQTYNGKLLVSK